MTSSLGGSRMSTLSGMGVLTTLARGIVRQHDVDLDSEHTLAKEDVADGAVDKVTAWVTSLDHVSITEFHALGTLGAKFARHNNFTSEGTALHDESQHTIARPADSEASEELEAESLSLGHGAKATVDDLLGVQLDGARGEVETLLHNGGQLANAAALLSEHVLCASSTD